MDRELRFTSGVLVAVDNQRAINRFLLSLTSVLNAWGNE